jgi:hypothetical protein
VPAPLVGNDSSDLPESSLNAIDIAFEWVVFGRPRTRRPQFEARNLGLLINPSSINAAHLLISMLEPRAESMLGLSELLELRLLRSLESFGLSGLRPD